MHDDRVVSSIKSGRPSRLQARRRQALRLGTTLSGAAAALLLGSVPAIAAAPVCGVLTLTAITCPASASYPGGIQYVIGNEDTPQDLTVHLADRISVDTGDDYVNGVTVSNFSGGAASLIADGASTIATHGAGSIGVAGHTSTGDLTIHVGDVTTQGFEAHGIAAGSVSGAIDVKAGAVKTTGDYADGIRAIGYSGAIHVSADSVETDGFYSRGVLGRTVSGSLTVDVGSVTTHGDYSVGIDAQAGQSPDFDPETGQALLGAPADLTIHAGAIATSGYASDGILATNLTMGETKVSAGDIVTTGDNAWGAYAGGFGNISLSADTVETSGASSAGLAAVSVYGNVDLTVGTVTTHGDFSNAVNIMAYSNAAQVTVDAGDVATSGTSSVGIYVGGSTGYVVEGRTLAIKADSVTTSGTNTAGVVAKVNGDVSIDLGTVVSDGDLSRGVILYNTEGNATIDIGSIETRGDVARGRDAIGLTIVKNGGTLEATIGSISTVGDHSPAMLVGGVDAEQNFIITGGLTTSGDFAAGFQSAMVRGALNLDVAKVATSGDFSHGIYTSIDSGDSIIKAGSVSTAGSDSTAVKMVSVSYDGVAHQTSVDAGTITTKGEGSTGVDIIALGNNASVKVGSLTTSGAHSSGIQIAALRGYNPETGVFGGDVTVDAGTIVTMGDNAHGIDTFADGKTNITVQQVSTSGKDSIGIHAVGYGDITINAGTVKTTGYHSFGIYAANNVAGLPGGITINADEVSTAGFASTAIRANAYVGPVSVHAGKITTSGYGSDGVYASSFFGDVSVDVGSLTTTGGAGRGIVAYTGGTATINAGTVVTEGQGYGPDSDAGGIKAVGAAVIVNADSVSTKGDHSVGIFANSNYVWTTDQADRDITISAGNVSTAGYRSDGVYVTNIGRDGNTSITVGDVQTKGDFAFGVYSNNLYGNNTIKVGTVSTEGFYSRGIHAQATLGNVSITGDSVSTKGDSSHGIMALTGGSSRSYGQSISVDVGSVSTAGKDSYGILTVALGTQMDTVIKVDTVKTTGDGAHGIYAYSDGRDNSISIDAGSVETAGKEAVGIFAVNTAINGDVSINVGSVKTTGDVSAGIFAYTFDGDVSINAGAVEGAGIGVSAVRGDVTIKAGSIASNNYEATGISASGKNVAIDVDDVTLNGTLGTGILALASDDVTVTAGSVTTTGSGFGILAAGENVTIAVDNIETSALEAAGIYATSYGRGNALDITINEAIKVAGDYARGIIAISGGTIAVHNNGEISTGGYNSSDAIYAIALDGITIDGAQGEIDTTGANSWGIFAYALGGDVSIEQDSVLTRGAGSVGVYANSRGLAYEGGAASGNIKIAVDSIQTVGMQSDALVAINSDGNIDIDVGSVVTWGDGSAGILAFANYGDVTVNAQNVTTRGETLSGRWIDDTYVPARVPTGIYALGENVTVNVTGTVSTEGHEASGIYAAALGGKAVIHANNVSAHGRFAAAVRGFSTQDGVEITTTGAISMSGALNAYGVLALGDGPLSVTNKGSIEVEADYGSVGIYLRTGTRSGSPIKVTNAGTVSVEGGASSGIRAVSASKDDITVISTGKVSAFGDRSGGIAAAVYSRRRYRDAAPVVALADEATPTVTVAAADVYVSGAFSTGIGANNNLGAVDVLADKVVAKGDFANGIVSQAIDLSIKANSVTADGHGIFVQVDTAKIEVGNVASKHGGVIVAAVTSAELTVRGSVVSQDYHAVELSAGSGTSVLNVLKGATVTGGGKVGSVGELTGPGYSIAIFGAEGSTINNAGTINNKGDGYTIYVFNPLNEAGQPTSGNHAVTINNSGLIEGDLRLTNQKDTFVNSGKFLAMGDSDFGDGDDLLLNSGTLVVRNLANEARAAAGTSVTLKGLERFENSGTIDLRSGAVGDTLTLTGNYVGSGNALLALDVNNGLADNLVIQGAATGSTGIVLNQLSKDATLLSKPIELVKVGAGSSSTAFHMAQTEVGLVHYTLAYNAGSFGLTSQAGAGVYRLAKLGEGAQAIWDQSAQAWSSHMTELRDVEGADTRVWGQVYGGVMNRDQSQAIGDTTYSLDDVAARIVAQQILAGYGAVERHPPHVEPGIAPARLVPMAQRLAVDHQAIVAHDVHFELRMIAQQAGQRIEQEIGTLAQFQSPDEQQPHHARLRRHGFDPAREILDPVRDDRHPVRLQRDGVARLQVGDQRAGVRQDERGRFQQFLFFRDDLVDVGLAIPRVAQPVRLVRQGELVGRLEADDRRDVEVAQRGQRFEIEERAADHLEPAARLDALDLRRRRGAVVQQRQRHVLALGLRRIGRTDDDAMDPDPVDEVDIGKIRLAAADHRDLVPARGEADGHLAGPLADAAVAHRRIVLRQEAEPQPVLRRQRQREPVELRRVSREFGGRVRQQALRAVVQEGIAHAVAHTALDFLDQPVDGGLVRMAVPEQVALPGPLLANEIGKIGHDLVQRALAAAVNAAEVRLGARRRVHGARHAGLGPHVAGFVLVVDLRLGNDRGSPAPVVQAHGDVGFVEEVGVLLVEAADRQQPVAPRREVGAGQCEEAVVAEVLGGAFALGRIPEAVHHQILRLEVDAAIVADESADLRDVGIVVAGQQQVQPVRLGYGVIVDERHDVAAGHGEADVARRRQVEPVDRAEADEIGMPRDDPCGIVRRRAEDDDHLEQRVAQLAQALQGPVQRQRPAGGCDHDGYGLGRSGEKGWVGHM
nr:pertactin-like passenger domain-containing protein [Novosphingobium kaempferiae]